MSVILSYRKLFFKISELWFVDFDNASDSDVAKRDAAAMQIFKQANNMLNSDFVETSMEFNTTVIDLHEALDVILKQMDYKSCRYEINKAAKLEDKIVVKVSLDIDEFLNIANAYITLKNYSKPITRKVIERYMPYGDLVNLYFEGNLVCSNFYIKDFPGRVRLLWSFNKRHENPDILKISGALQRYLHYRAIQKYKSDGYRYYDFGGVDLDPNASTSGITKFKLSFGGQILKEYESVIINNRLLRLLFKFKKILNR